MRKLKKGFTIVELVIVIGVIAILSAILIPTFVSLSDKANKAKASQEVSDTYTQYVIDKADKKEDYLAQDAVIIFYKSDAAKYVYKDGEWKVDSAAAKKDGESTALFYVDVDKSGDETSNDIRVFTLKVSA